MFVERGTECESASRAGVGWARILHFIQVFNPRTVRLIQTLFIGCARKDS